MSSKLRAAIIVISETASKDASTDKCIPALQEVFQQDGGDRWEPAETKIVADDVSAIRSAIKAYTDGADNANLVVTSGGTGFAQKDVTPEVSPRALYSITSIIRTMCTHPRSESDGSRLSILSYKSTHLDWFTACLRLPLLLLHLQSCRAQSQASEITPSS
jgi:molybdenum cofactor synthesis domain-containing protein